MAIMTGPASGLPKISERDKISAYHHGEVVGKWELELTTDRKNRAARSLYLSSSSDGIKGDAFGPATLLCGKINTGAATENVYEIDGKGIFMDWTGTPTDIDPTQAGLAQMISLFNLDYVRAGDELPLPHVVQCLSEKGKISDEDLVAIDVLRRRRGFPGLTGK